MKTVKYIFALCVFSLVSQAVYGMYHQAPPMYYIDNNYLMLNGICYQYQQLPNVGLILQPAPAYPVYSTYPLYSGYPMAQQSIGFLMPESFSSTESVVSDDEQFDHTDADVATFFREIICEQELFSFARNLLENAHNNDAIELVSKGAEYRSGPKPVEKKATPPDLKNAARLKKVFVKHLKNYNEKVQTRIQELFTIPLVGNNLIRLSDFASNRLGFSEGEVEIICILSLALYTPFKIFNGIDRLRWAVKKGLWQLTQKTLSEGIHPNWVVERGGMTALRTSMINGYQHITDLLLSVDGIDTTSYCYDYQDDLEQARYSDDVHLMTEQMKDLLSL
ncbi:hypothetical protein JST56_00270 [Candidatus Dependentiae bacterium]|nr:hypothetical protein [Candidatus Dependentiae bacterium]